ncbi:GTPase [Lactococcus petauri]|uniref:GTPase n=1 Tax=Lactococcus petauri TaxID=1940789 RepID=UPI0031FEABBF
MDNKKEYQALFSETLEKIEEENNNLTKMTILVSGKSGVGKSTLINSVFGDELTKTGIGKPITDKINLIAKEGYPIQIYDTVGLELKSTKFDLHSLVKSIAKNDIKKLIQKTKSTKELDDDIHIAWYAISGNSARIEDVEIDLINWIIDQGIPVIIVLTKSFDQTEAKKLKQEILNIVPRIVDVVITLAEDSDTNHAFGIDDMIHKTFDVLPESVNTAFVHSQSASIDLKKSESLKVVTASMAANFGIGFSPVPGSDGPLMMSAQTAMIARITAIFGVDIKKNQVETVISSMLGIYGALIAGKSLVGGISKLLPGLGTLGGGLISGGVGMVITGALGRAYIELMSLVITEKIDLSDISSDELTNILLSLLPDYLPQFSESIAETKIN